MYTYWWLCRSVLLLLHQVFWIDIGTLSMVPRRCHWHRLRHACVASLLTRTMFPNWNTFVWLERYAVFECEQHHWPIIHMEIKNKKNMKAFWKIDNEQCVTIKKNLSQIHRTVWNQIWLEACPCRTGLL